MSLVLFQKLSSNAVALEIVMGRENGMLDLFPSSYGACTGPSVQVPFERSLSRSILILLARAAPGVKLEADRPFR
jgi:hypothetical protein